MNEAPLILGINRTQDASVYKARLPGLDQPIDILVECYSSDAEHNKLAAYERELADTLRLAPGVVRAHISHHLAHAYSAFHPSPFERAAASVPGHWCEVASFYHADRDQLSCIDKQVWNRDEQRLVGLGMFYLLLTQAIFPGHGNEGKVMGLAPHGNPSALGLPPLHVEDWQVSMANWLHRETGADALCFAGGTALGCAIYGLTKRQACHALTAGATTTSVPTLPRPTSTRRWPPGAPELCALGRPLHRLALQQRLHTPVLHRHRLARRSTAVPQLPFAAERGP